MSQEKLETMSMQNFGGGKRGALWYCAGSESENPFELGGVTSCYVSSK